MSECVVRMEVPENCYECDMFLSLFVNDCPIYQKPCGQGEKHKYTRSRHPDCPIICSLPEGHGRLVDADKLADDMKARKAFFGKMSDPQYLVEHALTIVQAEAKRSET